MGFYIVVKGFIIHRKRDGIGKWHISYGKQPKKTFCGMKGTFMHLAYQASKEQICSKCFKKAQTKNLLVEI